MSNGDVVYCNGIKRGAPDGLETREPAEEWAGEGYCKARNSSGRCRFHGANVDQKGPGHPAYKDGRYSEYLPQQLRDKFLSALDDDDYMSLMDNIALADARVSELLETIEEGGTKDAWSSIEEALGKIKEARSEQDERKLAVALNQIEESVEQFNENSELWEQLMDAMDMRKKLVREERKRAEAMSQMIHRDRFITLMDQLSSTVKEVVEQEFDDESSRRRVLREFSSKVESLMG